MKDLMLHCGQESLCLLSLQTDGGGAQVHMACYGSVGGKEKWRILMMEKKGFQDTI